MDGVFRFSWRNDRDRIDSAERYQQAPIGQQRQFIGVEALAERRRRQRLRKGEPRLRDKPAAAQVDEREPIRIVLGGDQMLRLGIDKQCSRFAHRGYAGCDTNPIAGDGKRDQLPVPWR